MIKCIDCAMSQEERDNVWEVLYRLRTRPFSATAEEDGKKLEAMVDEVIDCDVKTLTVGEVFEVLDKIVNEPVRR